MCLINIKLWCIINYCNNVAERSVDAQFHKSKSTNRFLCTSKPCLLFPFFGLPSRDFVACHFKNKFSFSLIVQDKLLFPNA